MVKYSQAFAVQLLTISCTLETDGGERFPLEGTGCRQRGREGGKKKEERGEGKRVTDPPSPPSKNPTRADKEKNRKTGAFGIGHRKKDRRNSKYKLERERQTVSVENAR